MRADEDMTRKRLVVLGGPGDGLVVAEAILHATAVGQDVELYGFLNDVLPSGQILQSVPVLGRFEDWHLLDSDVMFVPAVQKAGYAGASEPYREPWDS
jgi:acetyltransferase EpsM